VETGDPGQGAWSLEAVAALLEGQPHSVRKFDPVTGRYLGDVLLNFADYAHHVRSDEARQRDLYWADHDQDSVRSTELAHRSRIDAVERALRLHVGGRPLSLWAGVAGHVEGLHYDSCDNLHLVLHGRKRWLIFAPSRLPRLHFASWWRSMRAISRGVELPTTRCGIGADPAVSLMDMDAVWRADPLVVELKAGDALYIPAAWAHQVEAVGEEHGGERGSDKTFVFSLSRFLPTPLRRLPPRAWLAVVRIRTYHAWSARFSCGE
jgi:lysine-specific demethylase 8/hypoxia-inducible factor 1-alpha inhibitor (HIF hydroxylase)